MGGIKKNIVVFFYLITVFGLGISSLFIGRRVADQQRKIIPPEAEAEESDCLKCCWEENCDKDTNGDGEIDPCYDGNTTFSRSGCKSCRMQKDKDCDKDGYWWSEGCDSRECPSPPTPTPTTPPPTPTPPPPPGCWETCTLGTCPSGLDCQNVGGLRCVKPACPSEGNCECPPLVCQDLTSDKDISSLKEGDKIKLTCTGDAGVDQPINHVKFRGQIDSGSWLDLGTASGPGFAVDYTIPQTGNYLIECRVCTSTDDSVCTDWGQAGVISP